MKPIIADSMQQIVLDADAGPPEALHLATAPTPKPQSGQLLVRVAAAGVNYPDILQRQGRYPMPPGAPKTLGLEIAGEVVAVGDSTPRFAIGERVCALLLGGGYAQYAVVDARHALPIPDGLTLEQAAGVPETVFTVFVNVFERAALKAGETLLVHGSTGGIGVTAMAMAKAAGARVIATSRGADKARRAAQLGADVSIDSSREDFVAAVTREGGADVVLDMVGGDFIQKNLNVLKPDGRLSQIAFLTGANVTLDLRQMLVKRLTFTGSTLRARSNDDKARLARLIEEQVWPWIVDRRMPICVDKVFALSDAGAAHAYVESGKHTGKVILKVS